MSDKWVSKIEATTLFKVTERTLDNWVKSGKINKARKNGQIMYEISDAFDEKQAEEPQFFQEEPPVNQGFTNSPREPQPSGPTEEELSLSIRIEEKMEQISMLRETLDKREKDMNTLIFERGQLAEQSKLLTAEAESLRKEKESIQKEFRSFSERVFSKVGVILFTVTVFILLCGIGGVLFWKYFEEKVDLESEIKILEDQKKLAIEETKEVRADKEQKIAEFMKNKDDYVNQLNSVHKEEMTKLSESERALYKKLVEANNLNSNLDSKASEAEIKISELNRKLSELQKRSEELQKDRERLQNENSTLQIQLKVEEFKNSNNAKQNVSKSTKPEEDNKRLVKDSQE